MKLARDQIRKGAALTVEEFSARFDAEWEKLSLRFFKYESLQYYKGEENAGFDAFRAGDYPEAIKRLRVARGEDRPFFESARRRGAQFVRVHAAHHPFSDYMQFEYYSYLMSEALGEEIYYVDERKVMQSFDSLLSDFVLFDNRSVMFQDFDESGQFQGGWFSEDREAITQFGNIATALMSHATPFEQYYYGEEKIRSLVEHTK